MSLRDIYRLAEQPGKNAMRDLHAILDKTVADAYGMDPKKDILSHLLQLNLAVAEHEDNGAKVQIPGWPEIYDGKEKFITDDCVKFEA